MFPPDDRPPTTILSRQDEMLGPAGGRPKGAWSVLLLDPETTRVLTHAAGVSDVFEYSISLVDDVTKNREPQPGTSAVYFLSPRAGSVRRLIEDFPAGGKGTYSAAYVFFSSPLPAGLLARIKGAPGLVRAARAIRELNLEYYLHDGASFTTGPARSLRRLFGAHAELDEDGAPYAATLSAVAAKLATVFASLGETPAVRFRAPGPPGDGSPQGLEIRTLACQRIAVDLWQRLEPLRASGAIPAEPSCDLILCDRAVDVVAPAMHEWTYEAMVFDLLADDPDLRGNVFAYEAETQGGQRERRETVLDDRDDLWRELRHLHFADASHRISNALDAFRAKNKLATSAGAGAGSGGGGDMRSMGRLARALPQYREELARLSAHVEIAHRLNDAIDRRGLVRLGRLEQDVVYGDATSKEVIAILANGGNAADDGGGDDGGGGGASRTASGSHRGGGAASSPLPSPLLPSDRVRLLLCYSATHTEKLDETRALQWQRVAELRPRDLAAVGNLEFLGVPVHKRRQSALAGLTRRKKKSTRRDRAGGIGGADESPYELARFVPALAELLEDAIFGRLSADDYPFVEPPDDAASTVAGTVTGGKGAGSGSGSGPSADLDRPGPLQASTLHGGASFDSAGSNGSGSSPYGSAAHRSQGGGAPDALSEVRSVRTTATWARRTGTGGSPGGGGGGSSSAATRDPAASGPSRGGGASLASATSSLSGLGLGDAPRRPKNRRLVAFVLGGITRSEIRSAHALSARYGRDVLIGGTSILTPGDYLEQLEALSVPSEALEIETPNGLRAVFGGGPR